jgi:hypothetical protein
MSPERTAAKASQVKGMPTNSEGTYVQTASSPGPLLTGPASGPEVFAEKAQLVEATEGSKVGERPGTSVTKERGDTGDS